MLLRSDAITGIRPVIQAEVIAAVSPTASPGQDSFNRLMQVSVGKQFQAEILSRQNDGTFLVRVADTTARMALPEGAKNGDMLSLTLVAANPRPTFLLGEQLPAMALPGQKATTDLLIDTMPQGAAQDSTSTSQVGKTAAAETITTAQPAPVDEPVSSSTLTSLSPAGRLIDTLLHTPADGTPASIVGKAAIAASPNVPPEKLAQAMNNMLELSGLFYESHVDEWANGKRSTEALMREPQAQLAANKSNSTEADQLSQLAMQNNETAHLIRMQLDTLEQRRFSWQGELWPGQPFKWEVSDETPQQQETTEAAPAWRSVMRFELPSLGAINASIRLSGGHVQVQLRTATESAATAIRPYTGELASALDAAGSTLDSLIVRKDESA